MIAIINAGNSEEVLEDINNMLFNCVEPKSLANSLYMELEEAIENGATEEYIYREMDQMIKDNT